MRPGPIQIDQNQLKSLDLATRCEVIEVLESLNDNACGQWDFPWCTSEEEYQEAWRRLFHLVPREVSYPLFAKAFAKLDTQNPHRVFLFSFLEGEWEDFSLFLRSTTDPPDAEAYLKVVLEYRQRNRDEEVAPLIRKLSGPFLDAGLCFSSLHYTYPRQKFPFMLSAPENREIGWEFLPLIEGSLKEDNCHADQVIRILEDLKHIGGPNLSETLHQIAKNHWHPSPLFARAFLDLASDVPFRKNLEKPVLKAMVLLIPERASSIFDIQDKNRIRKALHSVMLSLKREEKLSFFNSLVQQRPHYEEELRRMATLLLRLP